MPRRKPFLLPALLLAFGTVACDPIAVDDPYAVGAVDYPEVANPGDTITVGVRVIASTGRAAPGVTVSWSVVSGGGQITPLNPITDDSGLSEARWALSMMEGEQVARASVRRLTPVDLVVRTGAPGID